METVSNENSLSKDTDSQDNDLVLKLKKLTDRVALHETEKQKMRDEFGQQRAKMKELFLQKEEELKKESTEHDHLKELIKKLEAELNESKTQLTVVSLQLEGQIEEERRRFQDEVTSLQQLITETVDESSRNEEQVKKLWRLNEKLEAELEELRRSSPAGETVTGSGAQLLTAPTAMISTLARKVVSQLGSDSSANVTASDNLEESMRKAQEDAEVLRSLVIPLEEEIRALKDKLRYTDEKLRKYELNSEQDSCNEQFSAASCETLINVVGGMNKEGCVTNSDDSTSKIVISPTNASAPLPIDIAAVSCPISDLTAATAHSKCCVEGDENKSNELLPDFSCAGAEEVSNTNTENDENCRQRFSETSCSMCAEYESRLVTVQEKCGDLEKQITVLERGKEELAKEALIRKDMEQKWNEKKEIHKAEVLELQERVKEAHSALKETKELYKETRTQVTEELNRLTNERRNVQLQLDRLQVENENLIGKRNANARQLQDEVINLPDNVEELQVMLLKCREDLISARVGQEAAEQQAATLKEKAQLQRYQTQAENQTRQQLNNALTVEIESLKAQLHKSDMARHQSQLVIQRLNNEEKNMRLEIEDLNMQLVSTCNAKKHLEEQVSELKSRLSSLQTELHNSEIVQKDFVRLSQSLQQELERIRSSHTQVRWEHEDDVEHCPGCRQSFSVTRRKQHCRHCGRVFCVSCLTHTVLSGPNQRPSKVCDVCHTLLVEDTAPYFSTEPPYSNN